jgi:hypothetical protein
VTGRCNVHSATIGRGIGTRLVEEEPCDVRIVHAIIRDADGRIRLEPNVATDGGKARAFLRRTPATPPTTDIT